jgi:dihydrofolate reductase
MTMAKLRLNITMSLDGYVAGPNQNTAHPLGEGAEHLHDWLFKLKTFRADILGRFPQHVVVCSRFTAIRVSMNRAIMGRNMFGGGHDPWKGWWGDNPPFHHPVFVLTHFGREPLPMQGGTTFFFITDGIKSALKQARRAANGKDVALGGEPTSRSNISPRRTGDSRRSDSPRWWRAPLRQCQLPQREAGADPHDCRGGCDASQMLCPQMNMINKIQPRLKELKWGVFEKENL